MAAASDESTAADFTRFTDEEAEAIGMVRQALLDTGVPAAKIHHVELVVTTMNCKLRVDKVGIC